MAPLVSTPIAPATSPLLNSSAVPAELRKEIKVPQPPPQLTPPLVSFIEASAFTRACKMPGSVTMRLVLWAANTSLTPSDDVDLSTVSADYHEFANIFSDAEANTLAPHHPYDLKINLENDQKVPPDLIYLLSAVEQVALQKFLNENLNTDFIRQSSSSHGALILFVKKKN